MREWGDTMREANNEAFVSKLKQLAYIPHGRHLPDQLIEKLDELVEARELSDKVAVGRVAGTNRWVALFNDGMGILAFGTIGEAPALADVLSAARKAAGKEFIQ